MSDDLVGETAYAIAKFSKQFDVDIYPTDNKTYKENNCFYVQYKSEGKQFLGFNTKQLRFKVSLWFTNEEKNDYIECIIRFIVKNDILDSVIRLRYDKNKKEWESFKI